MSSDLRRLPRIGVATVAIAVAGAGVIGAAYWVGGDKAAKNVERPGVVEASAVRLVAFDSCDKALAELKAAAVKKVGPYGFESPMLMERGAAPAEGSTQKDSAAPGEYSGTNNHESAADEPDLVKTDGKRIVSIVDGTLRVVDVATKAVTATLKIPEGQPSSMLLDGDRALITAYPNDSIAYDSPHPHMYAGRVTFVQVDLVGGARVSGSLTVDGSYIDARQVGSVARVVVRSQPRLPFVMPTQGIDEQEATRRNKEVIEKSKIGDWIPRHSPGTPAEGQLYDCTALSRPADYTGTSTLSVLSFDLRNALGTGDGVGLAADGDTVYGTANSLYVADDRQSHVGILPADGRGKPMPGLPQASTTTVHQFDIAKPGKPLYQASGMVRGTLLNQYSLSEHRGNLRIATTMDDPGCCDPGNESSSSVAVLTRRGAELAEIGRLDGLGKTERIHSVRFIGDTGYVVTFRRTDPLYTVDLSDPAKPKVTGELKITGYSAYLHPVGDGRLLGVGQEATEQGRATGTQVSLFDTKSVQARKVTGFHVAGASSEVEFEPHAFLYWAAKGLVVLPLNEAGPTNRSTAVVLRLQGDSLTEAARLTHPLGNQYGDVQIRRSLVVGDTLWTVSGGGMLASDLDTLAQSAWVPFT
ncbi:Beta propeller domain-containing protein [Actinokineospora alba]|uniref:Beta propeller domain-containing protein n=1 Tax=Actinokineospora alba TaxID=504798 RepID=A0A1H0WE01_9PSEU|nr:beta-propeller domain-containing protein [Actinokineospora alba]TDP68902.1 beta propeller domain-containing protein [Actinokineospora alba]SDI74742.1 Beta propeller domain-containing protein [Actinokineospora alba]SDP88952.1 Beta propeller domain-containing protein [Actinokineospora alba]